MTIANPIPPFKNPEAVGSGFGRFFYGVDNTIYYSQVLVSSKNAGKCYQTNDPTSDEISDLIATDGGILVLDGAIRIRAFQQFRLGILIFCDNGLWYVYGADGGFTATSYNLSKISDRGITNPRSIISAEGSVYYFSDNGIMQVVANEFDNVEAQDITEGSIKTRYLEDFADNNIFVTYKSQDKEIWWTSADGEMLVLDMVAGAFYPQENASTRRLANPVTIKGTTYYSNFTTGLNSISYNFAKLDDEQFKDFGVDQEAFLVSGYETLGKFANKKIAGYGMFFFNKTETEITGYDEETNSYIFDSPSSCLFQSRWDFDNSNAYSKWVGRFGTLASPSSESGRGKKVELYKPLQRGFVPDSYPYTFDTGESIITKKVNIRGRGKAVQFRFEAQPEKDLQLLGYSVDYSMRGTK